MSTADLLPTLDHRPAVLSGGSLVDGAPVRVEYAERWVEPPWVGRAIDEGSALLEEFVATVAHELRTPLAIVQMAADTVLEHRDELGADQMAEMLRIIQRNSRLATMVLGRIELTRGVGAGEVQLGRELVDLVEIARQTTSDLADAVLRWHPTEVHASGPVMVRADLTAVREILFNLLSNATRYSPQGSYIDVSVLQRQDAAQITVRDRGRGILTPDAERVFEKHPQTASEGAGVGLGLHVSRGLARAHGGDLDVRPARARGSEFRLTLPNAAGDDGVPGSQVLDWACGGVACGLGHGSRVGAKNGSADDWDHPDQ